MAPATRSSVAQAVATSVAQPGANSGAQPADFLPLKELTSRSARIATLKLSVYHPWEDTYKYWIGTKEKTGVTFKCLLVDDADPQYYCHAEFKKTAKNEIAYKEAVEKYIPGATFVFKRVAFVEAAKASYLSAPKREVVNLQSTTAEAVIVIGVNKVSAVQPCPTGSVADKAELQQNQRFDITALIKTVSECRAAGTERSCFDVELLDGSKNPVTNKSRRMKVTLFETTESAPKIRTLAEACKNKKLPLTFIQLQGSKKDGQFQFTSAYTGWHMMEANAEQLGADKVISLKVNADALLSEEDTEAFEQKEFTPKDYSLEKGTETTVKLFLTLPRFESGVPDLDEQTSVWQINWARVFEPAASQTIHTSQGNRIWFPLTFQDNTFRHTLWITEKAALQLAATTSAEDFAAAHADGKLWFPPVCSLKILRKRNAAQPTSDGAAQPDTDYDAIIVEATEQDLKQAPTSESLPLIDMLAERMDSVDVFLPATLDMIKKSVHYSLCVHYDIQKLLPQISTDLLSAPAETHTLVRPCSQVFALVESTKGGDRDPLGEEGFKLVTKDVKDALGGAEQPATYTVTAYCTLDNVQNFKLDPPRGSKTQTALITISDIIPGATPNEPTNLTVDAVMLLHRDEVDAVKEAMKKLLYYIAAASEVNTRKRKREWTESFSPAKAHKCRSLSAHPTGDELPEYERKSS